MTFYSKFLKMLSCLYFYQKIAELGKISCFIVWNRISFSCWKRFYVINLWLFEKVEYSSWSSIAISFGWKTSSIVQLWGLLFADLDRSIVVSVGILIRRNLPLLANYCVDRWLLNLNYTVEKQQAKFSKTSALRKIDLAQLYTLWQILRKFHLITFCNSIFTRGQKYFALTLFCHKFLRKKILGSNLTLR